MSVCLLVLTITCIALPVLENFPGHLQVLTVLPVSLFRQDPGKFSSDPGVTQLIKTGTGLGTCVHCWSMLPFSPWNSRGEQTGALSVFADCWH